MSSMLKFKKRDLKSAFGWDVLSSYEVTRDGVIIGYVEQVESSKTGFKRGFCCGQVACKVWKTYDADGKSIGQRDNMLTGGGYRLRDHALDVILDNIKTKET